MEQMLTKINKFDFLQ